MIFENSDGFSDEVKYWLLGFLNE
jgi:hypothetical protein